MIHDTDYDRGDLEHEVKRDKALEKIWALQAEVAALKGENSLLTDALANYEQENARLRDEGLEANRKLAEHARDVGTSNIALRAEVDALTRDSARAHELAEHYRVENGRLREALREIAQIAMYVDADGLWEESPALDSGQMWDIARAALERKQ